MRRFLATLLIAPFLALPAGSPASAACARVPSDFNGDGYGDLAVGAPHAPDPERGSPLWGVLQVAYGSSIGLGKATTSVSFSGRSTGLPEGHFQGSWALGEALASGYFNGDCYADLAVSGASGSEMLVLYGSEWGLTTGGSAAFDRTTFQPDGEYGSALSADLAAGDFNGDGFDDLAAGAPAAENTRGAVGVLYGSSAGLTKAGARWIDQDSPGVPGAAEPDDTFGATLAAGDFNGDGHAELVVGAPGETIGGKYQAGGIVVFPGAADGPATAGSTWWDQDSPGVPGGVEESDQFGNGLTTGDSNADGKDELMVAASGETVGTATFAGMVHVFRGTASGLVAGSAFDQNNAQIPGDAESGDGFGAALTLVDMNRDGRRDLVVGVPGESAGAAQQNGAVTILYSTATGPSAAGATYLDQNSAGVPGDNEDGDDFGRSIARVVNAYGGEALVVAAPRETVTYEWQGAATVLPSAATGAARPAGVFFSGANFPFGASSHAYFGTGLT